MPTSGGGQEGREAQPPAPGATIARTALSRVRDVDGYRGAVAGVDIEAIRAGRGRGPNSVMTVIDDGVTVTACDIGFPILSRTTIADDRVVLAVMRSAPPRSRWCEIDLREGQTLVYGPGAEHHATNREGLRFAFATTTSDVLLARAEQLGTTLQLPGRGEVHELRPSGRQEALTDAFAEVTTQPTARPVPRWRLDGLLSTVVMRFASADRWARKRRDGRRLDSRHIAATCTELARLLGRAPAIHEMCAVAHVSERRLREAFVSVYDMPPSAFFRSMMLAEAHRRLVLGVPSSLTVSSVALDLGFDHLGRFARRYQQLYGQSPSVTLREVVPKLVP